MTPELAALSGIWAQSFGTNAAGYDEYRPPLPLAVCSWLGLQPDWEVVDIGAGTGQASRVVRTVAAHVVSVEADPRMHELIVPRSDGIDARLGTAEELPVGDGSADLVLSVSAWHWFDQDRAFAQAARALRPGGVLGIAWNSLDHNDPWGRTFSAATETTDNSVVPPDRRPGPHSLRPPTGAPFAEVETTVIRWNWNRSVDQVLGLIATYSVFTTGDSTTRSGIITVARELLESRARPNGVVILPMAARCWKARRLPEHP